MVALQRTGMPLDEFLRRQDEQPFELIEGEIVPIMSPKSFGSDYIARLFQRALDRYGNGDVFIETTFILPDTPDAQWVKGSRQPDVLYIAPGRLETYRKEHMDWRIRPLMLVPDLAIEVVSPTDRLSKVWRKTALYLDDGVQLVWVVNPMRETVTIFMPDEAPVTFGKADTLNGGALLPGFSLALNSIFEG